jgi:hypothetical protein
VGAMTNDVRTKSITMNEMIATMTTVMIRITVNMANTRKNHFSEIFSTFNNWLIKYKNTTG